MLQVSHDPVHGVRWYIQYYYSGVFEVYGADRS